MGKPKKQILTENDLRQQTGEQAQRQQTTSNTQKKIKIDPSFLATFAEYWQGLTLSQKILLVTALLAITGASISVIYTYIFAVDAAVAKATPKKDLASKKHTHEKSQVSSTVEYKKVEPKDLKSIIANLADDPGTDRTEAWREFDAALKAFSQEDRQSVFNKFANQYPEKFYALSFNQDISVALLKLCHGTGLMSTDPRQFSAGGAGPLHVHKSREKIAFLLDAGFDINQKATAEYFEDSPMHYAIVNEFPDQLDNLLAVAKEKNTQIDFMQKDSQGKTFLLLAVRMCSPRMVNSILKDNNSSINEPDENGHSPLHQACLLGQYETAKALIANGANIHQVDHEGNTPLHYLAYGQGTIETNLLGVSIAPKRDASAEHNEFGYVSEGGIYESLGLPQESIQSYRITQGEPGHALWHNDNIRTLENIFPRIEQGITQRLKTESDPEEQKRLKQEQILVQRQRTGLSKQKSQISGHSITEKCLRGKEKVAELLIEKGAKAVPNKQRKLPSSFIPDSNKRMAGIKKQLSLLEQKNTVQEKQTIKPKKLK